MAVFFVVISIVLCKFYSTRMQFTFCSFNFSEIWEVGFEVS